MRKEHQDVLNRLYAIANDSGATLSVKLKTVELIGKAYGMWDDRIPETTHDMTSEELKEELLLMLADMEDVKVPEKKEFKSEMSKEDQAILKPRRIGGRH